MLKAEYEFANCIIQRIERDELSTMLLAGKKQVIKTGEIAGIPFKIKIDSLLSGDQCREIVKRFPETAEYFGFCDGAIVDQKIMRDFEQIWSDELHAKMPFVEAWGYDTQAAIYQAVEGNMLPFIIAGATKEKPEPNIAAIGVPQSAIDAKLQEIEYAAQRYNAIKKGIIEPVGCGHCDYCRSMKQLTRIIDYREV
jgi:hypothetical protein